MSAKSDCDGLFLGIKTAKGDYIFFYNNSNGVKNGAVPCGFSLKTEKDFVSLGVDGHIREVDSNLSLNQLTKVLKSDRFELVVRWVIDAHNPVVESIWAESGSNRVYFSKKRLQLCRDYFLFLLTQPVESWVYEKYGNPHYCDFLNLCMHQDKPLTVNKDIVEHLFRAGRVRLAEFLLFRFLDKAKQKTDTCNIDVDFVDKDTFEPLQIESPVFRIYRFPKEKYPPEEAKSIRLNRGAYEIRLKSDSFKAKPLSVVCNGEGRMHLMLPVERLHF